MTVVLALLRIFGEVAFGEVAFGEVAFGVCYSWESGVVAVGGVCGRRCLRLAVLAVGGVGGVAVGGVAVSEVVFGGVRVTGSDAISVGVVVVTLKWLLLLSGLGWSDGFNRSVGWLVDVSVGAVGR